MKNVLLIVFMFAGVVTGKLLAQGQQAPNKEKMKVFESWAGRWQGEGSMQMGPGEAKKSSVDEHIESKLDGTIVVVEGVGKAKDASGKEFVVHHAFAVLSYDPQTEGYKFRSYLSDGRSTDAWLKVLEPNKFQWGFDSPRGKIRYNINIDAAKKTWNEVGEYSPDGNNWSKFFEMSLAKVE